MLAIRRDSVRNNNGSGKVLPSPAGGGFSRKLSKKSIALSPQAISFLEDTEIVPKENISCVEQVLLKRYFYVLVLESTRKNKWFDSFFR